MGSFGALIYISKTGNRRAKSSEIWDSWAVVTHIRGTFDFVGFKVIWGHSVHLSQNGVYIKTAIRRVKRTLNWDYGTLERHIWGAFDLPGFKVILGVIRCTCLKRVCISKMAGRRVK